MFTPKVTTYVILACLLPQVLMVMISTAGTVWVYQIVGNPRHYNLSPSGRPVYTTEAISQYRITSVMTITVMAYGVNVVNILLYGVIIIETALLVILFQRSIRRRKNLVAKKKPEDSVKETKVFQSVIAVCAIYIVTSCPRTINLIFSYLGILGVLFTPGYRAVIYMYYRDVADVLLSLNHSINIFVYITVNSRFRKILSKLFLCKIIK